MRVELFRADRRTDMTKLTVAFRMFANAPKNEQSLIHYKRKRMPLRKLQNSRYAVHKPTPHNTAASVKPRLKESNEIVEREMRFR